MAAPTRKRLFDIVGESKNAADGTPRQHLLARVDPADAVTLQRQPENPYDPNAVAVLWEGRDIGFLPREDAATIAPALDEGRPYAAHVHELRGGVKGYTSYGVKIAIAWDGKPLPPAKPLDEQQERSRRGKLAAMGRERDATGAFAGDSPKGGCMGVLIAVLLVGTAGVYSFV
ncbi:HIRAN domain-containing protein [Erythrobacter sp. T5W1-R]|uniref:HIRAN domain-containing protein n=1 Tax=Erythrobacter sp. T5W1-R TaxID=3101752 RepID=UPI002AFFD0A1|nr:HIRAN domain-containing protein [Erythrobacter sp. T5W1-R]MEA1618684.1 HIRAN domain-containing protein [Erythrobacter sp. T5W1-R]